MKRSRCSADFAVAATIRRASQATRAAASATSRKGCSTSASSRTWRCQTTHQLAHRRGVSLKRSRRSAPARSPRTLESAGRNEPRITVVLSSSDRARRDRDPALPRDRPQCSVPGKQLVDVRLRTRALRLRVVRERHDVGRRVGLSGMGFGRDRLPRRVAARRRRVRDAQPHVHLRRVRDLGRRQRRVCGWDLADRGDRDRLRRAHLSCRDLTAGAGVTATDRQRSRVRANR